MNRRYVVTDISTAPIDGCDQWLGQVSAPSNYRDPAKIAAYCDEKRAEQVDKAGLDPDLARITGIGLWQTDRQDAPEIVLCKTEADERHALTEFANQFTNKPLIGFNSLKFDWPFLMRRGAYLGVKFSINTDRYRNDNIDVSEVLTHRGVLQAKSLGFYVRRLGWTDLTKILSGAEEAQVPVTGRWDDLEASIRHDVTATYRLAQWCGVITPSITREMEMAAFGAHNTQAGIRCDE